MLLAWDQELLLLAPLPLILLVNFAQRQESGGLRLAGEGVLVGLPLLAGLIGALQLTLAPAVPGALRRETAALGAALLLSAALAGVVQLPVLASRLARVMPYDHRSIVHRLALVLSVILVTSQLSLQVTGDVLAQEASAASPLSRADLVLQEVPFLLAGFAGVGIFIRRSPSAAAERLGVVRPEWWQVALALAAAGAFYAFGNGMDELSRILTPGLASKVEAANRHLFSALSDRAGIATIAIAAGVCEEVLFRGALQPRLGLLWTAIVFTAVHTQYGLSIDALAVLVLALGLGLLRRVANTTTSALCHIAYNGLVGGGLGWIGLFPALAVESGLVVLLAITYFRNRRQLPGAFSTGRVGDRKRAD